MEQDWAIVSLARMVTYFFIVFFETVLGREHSEKVLKNSSVIFISEESS